MISLKNDGIKILFFYVVKFNILESQNKSGKAAGCMEDGQAAQAYPRQTIAYTTLVPPEDHR